MMQQIETRVVQVVRELIYSSNIRLNWVNFRVSLHRDFPVDGVYDNRRYLSVTETHEGLSDSIHYDIFEFMLFEGDRAFMLDSSLEYTQAFPIKNSPYDPNKPENQGLEKGQLEVSLGVYLLQGFFNNFKFNL